MAAMKHGYEYWYWYDTEVPYEVWYAGKYPVRIQEIVSTGKLSKLEHFETDEKVRTVSLFGEVWGIGPATALKLYDKGHRTLDDLKNEDSLTNAQRLGLKYFDDIKTRIPRHEVQEMEQLLQKAAEEILPEVVVICGGSYRRGKASCGDMDIVITHPDGKRLINLPSSSSNIGFLRKYVKHLKDIKFLREDLIFSIHSEEDTDTGVDTYFGLCTYPGRELRHRIDLKVYPRDIYAFGLIAWTGNDVLNRSSPRPGRFRPSLEVSFRPCLKVSSYQSYALLPEESGTWELKVYAQKSYQSVTPHWVK
ncbi:hypothetical protein TEA_017883 [Camellia sinensis var. sinensis]|uniref:DNA polymerase n=1 Tax=Camellia sinensis var. sinensis TaxID=542762 RepID=A0A4V3WMJ8_CAMSN|nr:hypothetical protein TEA_017883 [Camellia sinensis var. sinensis]